MKIMEIQKAVEEYLKNSDKKWQWEEVKAGDSIVVDYIWRLEDGTVFDTSHVENIMNLEIMKSD